MCVAALFVPSLPQTVHAQSDGDPGQTVGKESAEERARRIRRQREADDENRISGTLRLGGEYDSNALRREVSRAEGDGLGRYFLAVDGELAPDADSRLAVRLQQGGKLFWSSQRADALLTEAELRWSHRLAASESGGLRATFGAGIKDRLERSSRQDYNRGSARGGIAGRLGTVSARLQAGWQYFIYRPNPASSSHGPQATAGLGVQVADPVRLQATYTLSRRLFQSIRLVYRDEADVVQRDMQGRDRRDTLHVLRAGGTYRGPVILEANYLLLLNRSNSYGQGMVRHGVEVDLTAPLPWRLYLSLRGRLQWTFYEEPIFLGADFRVDEDNRNAAIVSLTRVIGEHWEIEGRYRLFIEEFGARSDYRRQTGFLGVGYVF